MTTRHAASAHLRITLLGRISIRTDAGIEIRLAGRHAQALFTLLAMSRRPRLREAIAADLWPDAAVGASTPLRQALYQLRMTLGAAGIDPDEVLEADAETLGLRPEVIAFLDIERFEACTDDPACAADVAVALYGGDLAEGLPHECFAAERERLSDRFEDALATLAAVALSRGDLDGARRSAERLLTRDPLREEAHAVLLEVYGSRGSRSQVARQYRRLCAVLGRELGERPLPETDSTYRSALRRCVERSRERAAAIEPHDGPVLVAVGE